jgi:hypothetical protein
VVQGLAVLDQIEAFVDSLVSKGVLGKDTEEKARKALAKTRALLLAAEHASRGAQHANDQKVTDAFAEFQQAYREVLALLGPFGLSVSGTFQARATEGGLAVPAPEAFSPTAKP